MESNDMKIMIEPEKVIEKIDEAIKASKMKGITAGRTKGLTEAKEIIAHAVEEESKNSLLKGPIKPCPWCGEPGVLIRNMIGASTKDIHHHHYVRCSNIRCLATAPRGSVNDLLRSPEDAEELAIKLWNKRA